MSTYTNELNAELERVALRGNPDKKTLQKLSSIIWRLDQRIQALEDAVVVDEHAPAPQPVEEKPEPKRTSRKVSNSNKEDK
mgnify:CR=1 FL=1